MCAAALSPDALPLLSASSVEAEAVIGRSTRITTGAQQQGCPCRVFVARRKGSTVRVALKKYNLEKADSVAARDGGRMDANDIMDIIRTEVSLLRQLRHPNLLPCLSSFVDGTDVVLVSPHMTLGSVRDLIDSHFHEGLAEMAVAFVLRDVIAALKYLHAKGIVHRSLRCSHILLSDQGSARLSGLKYACSLLEGGRGLQDRYDYPLFVAETNLNWLSPEYLQQNLLGYNEKSDIYSLGVTACEAANGIVPFSEMPATLMLLEKFRGAAPKLIDSTTFSLTPEQQDMEEAAAAAAAAAGAVAFPAGSQPADSGVGASVGSCSNGQQQRQQQHLGGDGNVGPSTSSLYARRTFTGAFHSFVSACCRLEAQERPGAAQLVSHPFVKQLKKTAMSLSSILESVRSIDVDRDGEQQPVQVRRAGDSDEDEENLSGQFESSIQLSDFQWDF